ncbi:hypothetical protein, partial [Kocuria rosea]|uniref:hypothetical protein n=1 Tax=Kocuria rosea TaxID=1275 RepID=UPI002B23F814
AAPIYYRDPDGKPLYSATPKQTPDGRDYLPVFPEADAQSGEPEQPANAKSAAAKSERKVKYYRNPMGLADTSPVPKKDWMGMDYIAVYEGDEEEAGTVKISLEKVQRTGVRTATVERRALLQTIRAP